MNDDDQPTPAESPRARRLHRVSRAPREPSSIGQQIAAMSLVVAREQLGRGEAGGNNRGRWVVEYRGGKDDGGAWCAALVSYDFEEAAERVGYDLPWGRDGHVRRVLGVRLPFARSNGAKRLTERIAAAGRWVVEPRERHAPLVMPRALELDPPRAGDVICWHRGRGWQGHVAHVEHCEDTSLTIIEGNAGAYPAVVRRRTLAYRQWAAGLHGIARLVYSASSSSSPIPSPGAWFAVPVDTPCHAT